MSDLIKLQELTKKYGNVEVVKNVSMYVKEGEIYGFLGPNGAGKTTIMKMILNLVRPDFGNIHVFGESIEQESYLYLKQIGNIIEYPAFYEKLTAWKNLNLHSAYMGYYDKKRIKEVMELVGLQGVEEKLVSKFSLGMKQRLGIARAILTRPKLLILDEPINGLDPIGIKEIRELFVKLKKEYGITILISSHIISEVEQIADRIGVLKEGQLLKEVSMDEIKKNSRKYLEIEVDDQKKAITILEEKFHALNYKIISENSIRIYENIEQKQISKELVLGGVGILNITCKNDTLEEYFIHAISEYTE